MKSKVIELLKTLRDYAISKGIRLAIEYHQEDSYLMRFANSAISLIPTSALPVLISSLLMAGSVRYSK